MSFDVNAFLASTKKDAETEEQKAARLLAERLEAQDLVKQAFMGIVQVAAGAVTDFENAALNAGEIDAVSVYQAREALWALDKFIKNHSTKAGISKNDALAG